MNFRLLGSLELAHDDVVVTPERPKERALLVFLLLHPNEAVAADVLLENLWPGAEPRAAKRSLQVHVSRLRPLLEIDGRGPRLESTTQGYLLHVGPAERDLDRFESEIGSGRAALDRGDPVEAAIVLRDALALWRGSPLADVAYEPFAQAELGRLEELRLVATAARIDADLRLGRHRQTIPELRSLVVGGVAHETFCELLMLALYRSGRQEEALEVYRRAHGRLLREQALEPSPRLRDLERAVLNHDPRLTSDVRGGWQPRDTRRAVVAASAGSGLDRGERRHSEQSAAHVAALAEAAGPQLRGPEQVRWLRTLDAEAPLIRAACRWALSADAPAFVLDLGAALWPYWETRSSLDECRAVLDAALASADPRLPARSGALVAAGRIALRQGDLGHARRSFAAALPALRATRDIAGLALAKSGLAWVALSGGEYEAATTLAREAVAPARHLDEAWVEGDALNTLGTAARLMGDLDRAGDALHQSLALRRRASDLEGVAATLGSLAWLDVAEREFGDAESHLHEALTVSGERNDRWFATAVDLALAHVALARGDLAAARSRAVVGLRACSDLGTVRLTSSGLRILAAVEALSGAPGGAAILAGAAAVSGVRDSFGARPRGVDYGWETRAVDVALAAARDRLHPAEWQRLTSRGETLTERELQELVV